MDRPTRLSAAALALCLAVPAAGQMLGAESKAEMELVADRTSYAPGAPARIAARVEIERGWHVNSHTPTFEWLIPTELRLELPEGWAPAEIEYPPHAMKTFAFEDEPLAVYDGEVVILASLTVPEDVARDRARIRGVLSYQACDDRQCLPPTEAKADVELVLGGMGEPVDEALFEAPRSGEPEGGGAAGPGAGGDAGRGRPQVVGGSLAVMLLLGVLGGLILNAMPCVLPVLSLKVFGLVKSAGQGRSHVVGGSLATAAGILLSFWGLAAAAAAAKAAGAAVGWGIQFQNPLFVTFLLVVVVLFCLNLWGLFEIQLPQALARAAGTGPREGVAGHLASGLFATLMATPCSAPFLGTALAFALAQSAGTIFAMFTAVGVGMALPYLALAAFPGAARLLPRPGAWMDTLRKVMGFLLAGAAVWLLYVLGSQVSLERRAWIELTLLGIALLVWLRHRAVAGPLVRRSAGVGVAALVLVTLAVGWRADEARALSGEDSGGTAVAGLIEWEEFDRARAEALASEGRLVFVDVTADWCFTCKVNERLVLETAPVAEAFGRFDVVPMKADWTNRSDTIAAFLEDHGRYGIPFYLLYRPGAEPHVF
ncbi:MAG TPA: thioredoxin family protein, partial [Thermoanaerobaculia bacterium]